MIAAIALLALAASASASPSALEPGIYLARDQAFCSPGVWEHTKPAREMPAGLKEWGSFCKDGDKTAAAAETSPFLAPRRFAIYLAGHLPKSGLALELENLAKHSRAPVVLVLEPGDYWVRYDVQLPDSWRGDPVRLIARDDATETRGWLAFSEPVSADSIPRGTAEATQILLQTALFFLLTVIPGLAMGVLAIRRGMRDTVLVGVAMLAGIGACGYLAFWLWFFVAKLGYLFSLFVSGACALFIAWNYRKLGLTGRKTIRRLLRPLAFTGVASLLILSTGFLHGGLENPLDTARTRFSHPLAGDNKIPYLIAEDFKEHHKPSLEANWLSSDRPPLQTGLVLSQDAYRSYPREFAYTVQGVLLQSLWIFGMWLVLTGFDLDVRAIALILAISLFSGFVFLNSFYVWPKLLAAAFTLGFLAITVTPRYRLLRSNRSASILAGVMLSFAMLSHGGSAFAIIGAALAAAVLHTRVPLSSLALVFLSAIVIYTPWTLYQRFYDPPGDRLLNMHLAGDKDVDSRPFRQILISAYTALTPKQIISNKAANVSMVFEKSDKFWVETKDIILHIREQDSPAWIAWAMRGWMFYGFVANLGFFMIGPLALSAAVWKRYRTKEWRTAAVLWMFVAFTLGVWCLLMFGPATTVIHQGSYAIVLLAYAGSILAIWTVSRIAAVLIGILQISLNVLLYIVFMQVPMPHALAAERPLLLGPLALCAVSLICVLWLLGKLYWTVIDAGAELIDGQLANVANDTLGHPSFACNP